MCAICICLQQDRPEVATDVSPVEAPAFWPDEDEVTVESPDAPSLRVCKNKQPISVP